MQDNVLPSSLSPNKSATLRSDRSSYNCKHSKNNNNLNNNPYDNYNHNDDNLVVLRNPSSSLQNTILSTSSSSTPLSSLSATTTINHLHQINLLQQHKSNNFNSLNNSHYQEQQYRQERFNGRETATFRWSEQLTQNVVSVAKIRSAASCTAQDIKEMEFLLPQRQHQHHLRHQYQQRQQQPTTQPNSSKVSTNTISNSLTPSTSSLSSISSNNSCNSNMLAENIKSTSTPATGNNNSLSISRHSNSHKQQHHLNGCGNNGNSKNGTIADENNDENNQNLAIYRQPASVRTTKGGNTPHRSKMSKKQLKLAQAQLDKLTQCNLHLHGNNETQVL